MDWTQGRLARTFVGWIPPRARHWVGRALVPVATVLGVLGVLATYVRGVTPGQWSARNLSTLVAPDFIAYALVVMWLWLVGLYHERSLCEVCVARMPLDPAARAQRRRRWLRAAHLPLDHQIGSTLLLVGLMVAGSLPWVGNRALMIVLMVVLMVETVAIARHGALQPWCPWCHNGGGGDTETTPTPTPVGEGVR